MTTNYKSRREDLCQQLPEGALVIISGATHIHKSGDQKFPFWQNSDFFYLTGWEEADAVLLLYKLEKGQARCLLFHPENSLFEQKWHGGLITQTQAVDDYGFDEAYILDQLPLWLQRQREKIGKVFSLMHDRSLSLVQESLGLRADLEFLPHHLRRKRLVKAPEEIEQMKKSCALTVDAHRATMVQQSKKAYRHEYEIAATFYHHGAMHGAQGLAYDTIAACGANACVLHYTENRSRVDKGACVLLDAGLRWGYYGADVTRVWPISGRFSSEQKLIYAIVLAAHQQSMAMLRPGVAWADVQQRSEAVMIDGLRQAGLIKSSVTDADCIGHLYGHGVGHSLGLDVHDPSPKRGEWVLGKDMVLTVEPGLYLADAKLLKDERFVGIGVRIEDNIQIVEDGCLNLTSALPVDIVSIEALVQGEM
jgi:Xaa-Pro aminopeptidase